jgi:hypothetical protein
MKGMHDADEFFSGMMFFFLSKYDWPCAVSNKVMVLSEN